jgi:NTE family protein
LRTFEPYTPLPDWNPTPQDERVALILSAGGVFGAYQAGVWSAIADSFTPDLIIGASIGSLNGWLIASGCPPAEIERFWLEAGDLMRLRPKFPRRWSSGVFDFRRVAARFAELCEQYRPAIPLFVALTEIRRLRPVLASGPSLGCAHLIASCAVPAAFDLQRIDGLLYGDGGLLRALPLWAAPLVGATRVVAINAMPPAPFRRSYSALPPNTSLIQPDPPLGSYFAMLRYRRDCIERWIETGRQDGLRLKHSIAKCFARQ